ncbi:MAG TPA: hypothetical protein VGO00_02430 [Kofleriaceae bacterium]|nr:hypothetical protein [Kofleriaceae bacterium]
MRLVWIVLLVAACRPPGYGKHDPGDPMDGVDASIDSPPVAPDAPSGCDHAFRLDGHSLSASAWLTGDFVGWAANPGAGAIAFTLGQDGAWTGDHVFATGTWQYKFILDGTNYIPDPTNTNTVDDGFGGKNSVLSCAL